MLGVVFIAIIFPVLKSENADQWPLAAVWELGQETCTLRSETRWDNCHPDPLTLMPREHPQCLLAEELSAALRPYRSWYSPVTARNGVTPQHL